MLQCSYDESGEMALSSEVMRVLSIRKDWMTQAEIREEIKPHPKSLRLWLTLESLVDQERIECHKERGVTRYHLMQLGGSRAPESNKGFPLEVCSAPACLGCS